MKTMILAAAAAALLGSAARAQEGGEIGRKGPHPAHPPAHEIGHVAVGQVVPPAVPGGPALPDEFRSVVRQALRSGPAASGRVDLRREEMGWYLERLGYGTRRYREYGADAAGALMERDDRGFTVLIWESPDGEPGEDGLLAGRAFVLDAPFDMIGTALELEVRYGAYCHAGRDTCAPVSAQVVDSGPLVQREVRKLWELLDRDFQRRPPSIWPF